MDPHMYQCESCVVAQAFEALEPVNERAWELHQLTCTRYAVDTHAAAGSLGRLLDDDEDYADHLMRQTVLYNVLYPPKDPSGGRR